VELLVFKIISIPGDKSILKKIPWKEQSQSQQILHNRINSILRTQGEIIDQDQDKATEQLTTLLIGTILNDQIMHFLLIVSTMSASDAAMTFPRHPGDFEVNQPTLLFSDEIKVDDEYIELANEIFPEDFKEITDPFRAYRVTVDPNKWNEAKVQEAKIVYDSSGRVEEKEGFPIQVWAHGSRYQALVAYKDEIKKKLKKLENKGESSEIQDLETKQAAIIKVQNSYGNWLSCSETKKTERWKTYIKTIEDNKTLLPNSFLGSTLQIEIYDEEQKSVKRVTHDWTRRPNRNANDVHIPIFGSKKGS
jgi:hypothetical protein